MTTKILLAFIYFWSSVVFGQVNAIRPDVIETASTFKNYIKNPSARINTKNTNTTTATITKDTGSPVDKVASFLCDSSAVNGYCVWSTETLEDIAVGGVCEASLFYKGDATKYILRLTDTSSTLVDSALLSNVSVWTEISVLYDCGSTRDVRLFQLSSGNGAAVNVSRVFYGRARAISKDIFSSTPGELIYGGADHKATALATGSAGQTIRQISGRPAWVDIINKNYITSPDGVEATGWSTYSDAAGAIPVDCSGGSPVVTWAASNTSSMHPPALFTFTKDAANRQGNGASFPFTVDIPDRGKPLQIEADWAFSSGTFVGSTNPSTPSDVIFYIYDVSNGVTIEPAGRLLEPAVSSGTSVTYTYKGTFQTAISGGDYRLCIHTATTSASAYTLQFDNIRVGRPVTGNGAAMNDFTSFTPTGTWSANTTYTGRSRRVGDATEINAYVALTGAPTGNFTLNMPSGVVIDTTKISKTQFQAVGVAYGTSGGGATNRLGTIYVDTSTAVRIVTDAGSAWNATTPGTFGNTDFITLSFMVPVVGWSSNVQLANDTDTRSVYMKVNLDSGNMTSSYADITAWNDNLIDSHGGMNTSTGIYTVQVAGRYKVYSQAYFTTTGTTHWAGLKVVQNSTDRGEGFATAGGASTPTPVVSTVIDALAGDTIKIRVIGDGTDNFSTTQIRNTFTVERLSGPSQIAASETVSARYFASSTSVSGSAATVVWTTKDWDDHSGMSSGVYTCPISGKYLVTAQLQISATIVLNSQFDFTIQKNGSTTAIEQSFAGGAETAHVVRATDTIQCLAGDTIRVQVSSGATSPSIASSNTKNFITITRVGNY